MSKIVTVSPPIESLLAAGNIDSFWPRDLIRDPTLWAEAELRRKLFGRFGELFMSIPSPTTELTEMIDSGKIDPELIRNVHEMLADFLETSPLHGRLIMYLPFELIPNKSWRSPDIDLNKQMARFMKIYLQRWRELLDTIEVRANYNDGDILEPELSPYGQTMVVKAAHLIVPLVRKGWLSIYEVAEIFKTSPNYTLRDSVNSAITVLQNISSPPNITNSVRITDGSAWLKHLPADADFELRKIEMRAVLDESRSIPKLRVAWERLDRENKLIDKYADIIAEMIVSGRLTTADLKKRLRYSSTRVTRLAIINGLGRACELIGRSDPVQAKKIFLAHESGITKLWGCDPPGIRNALTSILCRLSNMNVLDEYFLKKFGLQLPILDAEKIDGRKIIAPEINDAQLAVDAIIYDPKINKLIYPIIVLYGSRLKGYATDNSDLDVLIFVRPGIDINRRVEIQKIINEILPLKSIGGKVVEFWLDKQGDQLAIRNFPNPDVLLADSSWIHLPLAGVWCGDDVAIDELYKKLLPGFIYSKNKMIDGRDARQVWLSEMEREVLQYRLMHKGYRRYYAEQGPYNDVNASQIDGASAFWDSGYRRVATRLFISRVFLPQI